MDGNFDFIAIGDTVTDAFIHLVDGGAHIDIDKNERELCVRFGDKIPYDEVYVVPAVGNSANAAVSAARLGLKSALVANIGDDYFGKECLSALDAEHVSTEFIKVNQGYKTNYHYVLWFGDDRTILIKHEDYPYALPDIGSPKWVYLSSAGEKSLEFHRKMEEYLGLHPEVKLAFQPGTFQMRFGKEKLKGIYKRTEALFCNKQEAQRILENFEEDIKKLLEGVAALGPKVVAITDGVKGAYAYDAAGSKKMWFIPQYPDPKPPVQRTGAGDAFSSTFTVALLLGKSVEEALMWGPINSMSVVQGIGARQKLLTMPELEKYLREAPKEYIPQEI